MRYAEIPGSRVSKSKEIILILSVNEARILQAVLDNSKPTSAAKRLQKEFDDLPIW